ncbi:hypothetical protein EMIT053CA3_100131 [Pseudomonas donghuensis]
MNRYNSPHHDAGIAQLVEHDLAKVGVASSSLVSRSKIQKKATQMSGFFVPEKYLSVICIALDVRARQSVGR